MRKYLYIGGAGFLGAVLRYLIKGIQLYSYHGHIPLNTLFINVLGTFLMAFIMTIALELWSFDADVRLGLTTGFLGAFTTFSTVCRETALLLKDEVYLPAAAYIAASILLGLGAAFLGIAAARGLRAKTAPDTPAPDTDADPSESDVD